MVDDYTVISVQSEDVRVFLHFLQKELEDTAEKE
jgi:hypothetical protein